MSIRRRGLAVSEHAQLGGLFPSHAKGGQDALRRALDIAFAVSALAFFSLLMALAALAIYLESGGPVFFSQVRLGQAGQHFRLYKFRKFPADAGRGGPAVTVRGDARMTVVGRILERTKLDELPQLWNVLVGDMSIVGPRPESLAFAACFGRGYRGVLDFKPGLFGPSQVMFRNEGCLYGEGCEPEEYYSRVLFPLKAHADLTYFNGRSLRSDLWCIVHGTLAVFGLSQLSCEALPSVAEVEALVRQLMGRP